jgi:hypothetical protein
MAVTYERESVDTPADLLGSVTFDLGIPPGKYASRDLGSRLTGRDVSLYAHEGTVHKHVQVDGSHHVESQVRGTVHLGDVGAGESRVGYVDGHPKQLVNVPPGSAMHVSAPMVPTPLQMFVGGAGALHCIYACDASCDAGTWVRRVYGVLHVCNQLLVGYHPRVWLRHGVCEELLDGG